MALFQAPQCMFCNQTCKQWIGSSEDFKKEKCNELLKVVSNNAYIHGRKRV
jgi:hypothetical protein